MRTAVAALLAAMAWPASAAATDYGGGNAPAGVWKARTARVSMSGALAGATGSGTASVRLVFRRGGRVRARCRSGPRAWQVRAPAAEPVGAAARPNGAYFGLTSQGARRIHPFVLRVSRRGGRVMTAVFDYRQRCGFGPREWNNITPGGRVRADGTFRLSERFVYRYRAAIERFRVRVDGRFTPNGVSGTFSVRATARARGSGRVVGRCRTGRQSFAAGV